MLFRPRLRAVLRAGTALSFLVAAPAIADQAPAQPAQVAQAAPQTAPTDIGRVSASGGDVGDGVTNVKPSGTGTRAQAKAAEHAAINKIIVQPQSEIEKLPDRNIAEALSRLPGISLESDSGEGRFINIRGLDADLNATSFDGVRLLPSNLSSPFGGGRAVAYDALPAGLVGGLEIIEAHRPEDDAEGIGGLVNLLPKAPPGNGQPFLEATGGLGLEALRNTQILDYGVTVGASFGIQAGQGPFDHPVSGSGFLNNPKPFTIIITDAQHNDYRGLDDFEPGYADNQNIGEPDRELNNVSIRHYLYNRRRFDHGAEFDFDPNDTDHFFVRWFLSGYNEHAEKDFLNLNDLDSGFTQGVSSGYLDPNNPKNLTFLSKHTIAQRTNTDTEEETRNQLLEWGGRDVLFDSIKIDYHGAYSEGTDKFPTAYGSTFTDLNTVAVTYNNQINPAILDLRTVDGTNLADPRNYVLTSVSNSPSSSRDREYSGAFNVTVPFDLISSEDQIKAGAVLRLRDRIVQNSDGATYTSSGTSPLLSQYVSGPDLVFYNGQFNIGPSINAASVNSLLAGIPTSILPNGKPALYDPNFSEHDTENVYAGYIQYQGKIGKLSWLGGVRVEDTFGVYRGVVHGTNPDGSSFFTPNTFKHDYTGYFPDAQLKYDVTPVFDVRAIYSTSVARPGFNEITPGVTLNLQQPQSISFGNPNLQPYYADSFDVFAEYYLPRGGKVSFGGFDKEFNTYIFPTQTEGPVNFPGLVGIPNVTILSYSNSGPARVYGLEGEYTQQFTFLPSPLDGFGIDSNITYNQSEATITRPNGQGVVTQETTQLPSTSPWNFNAAVFYEKDPITFRLAANYVSKNLFALGNIKATDVYSSQRFRLDLGTAYRLTKNFEIYFDSHNLTDQPLKFTETASNSRSIQREFYGVDVIGGIRISY
jgi:TonB-dependent receptor